MQWLGRSHDDLDGLFSEVLFYKIAESNGCMNAFTNWCLHCIIASKVKWYLGFAYQSFCEFWLFGISLQVFQLKDLLEHFF